MPVIRENGTDFSTELYVFILDPRCGEKQGGKSKAEGGNRIDALTDARQ
jgi:hypothetical protein